MASNAVGAGLGESEALDAAARLDAAEAERSPIAPLTDAWPEMTPADAYRVQQALLARKLEAGERLTGHKVGLTSKPMQEMMKVDEPDYGALLESWEVENGGSIDVAELIQPRIEPEVSFRLRTALRGPGVDIEAAAAAVSEVVPSLEVIDSRIESWRIKLADTIADFASSARFVIGAPVTIDAIGINGLAEIEMRLLVNGEEVDSGTSSAVLGNPLASLAWLANKLDEYGTGLEPGQVILPGSLCRAVDVVAGDFVEASFSGLGPVSVGFHGRSSRGGA